MRKLLILILALVLAMFMAVSCDTAGENATETTAGTESESGDVLSSDPSANQPVEIMGVVKEIKDNLVLIEMPDNGGDFMLRFSENTKWDTGINTEIVVGNSLVCLVKLEPTVTTPSQGEVMQVTANNLD